MNPKEAIVELITDRAVIVGGSGSIGSSTIGTVVGSANEWLGLCLAVIGIVGGCLTIAYTWVRLNRLMKLPSCTVGDPENCPLKRNGTAR